MGKELTVYQGLKRIKTYATIQEVAGFVFLIAVIIFSSFNSSIKDAANSTYPSKDESIKQYQTSANIALAFLIFGIITSFIFGILIIYMRKNIIEVYDEQERKDLKNILPLWIANLLFLGILAFFFYKRFINKMNECEEIWSIRESENTSNQEKSYSKSFDQIDSEKIEKDKLQKIQDAANLKEKNLISEEEFLKLKEDILSK